MTSYQKRKQEILYYKQCVEDLKYITRELISKLEAHNIPLNLISISITGDTLLTPYNTGDFSLDFLTIPEEKEDEQ